MQIEKIEYQGWPNCYRLTNGLVELVATADIGPRIIHFSTLNGANLFKVYQEQAGKTGGDDWRIYGGHRLWHAPEAQPRTYEPDNDPVHVERLGEGLLLQQAPEQHTGIQKSLRVRLDQKAASAALVHELKNLSPWPVILAPWALTVMAPGGVAIVSQPPRGGHDENLLPVNTLALWAYTDLGDPRWTWGKLYILLRQDPGQPSPQKLGLMTPEAWAAYAREDSLFVKTAPFQPGAKYPDLGSNIEIFTNGEMLELETLGPLVSLSPGETVRHEETWWLFDGVARVDSEEDVEREVLPRIAGKL